MMELIGYEKRKYETNLNIRRLNADVIVGRKENAGSAVGAASAAVGPKC